MSLLKDFVSGIENPTNLEVPALPDFKNTTPPTPPIVPPTVPPTNPPIEQKIEKVEETPIEQKKEEEKPTDTPSDDVSIFDYLESKHGLQIEKPSEVTYEAMANYISKLQEETESAFEKKLAEIAPNAYKALLYEINGGDVTDFFKPKTANISIKIDKADATSQEVLIREYFTRKGVADKSVAEAYISDLKKSEGLYDKAIAFQREMQQQDRQKEEEMIAQKEKEKKEEENRIVSFLGILGDSIKKGDVGDFQIPENDKKGFYEYVTKNTRAVNNGSEFIFQTPIKSDSLPKTLQSLYFAYKEGNLDKLVQAKAATNHTKSLVFKSQQGVGGTVKGSSPDMSGKNKTKDVLSSFFNKQQ